MPIHNWKQATPGLFHHFHQQWTCALCDVLNEAVLPDGFHAMIERKDHGVLPETLGEVQSYARKANRIGVRTSHGELVAAIELVSPGNKSGKHAITSFVEKAVDFLYRGVNLLIIDLFPPTPRDPSGIHKLIWDEIVEEPFDLPAEKPLTVAAYEGAPDFAAYVDSVGVGDTLPEAPLFFHPGRYVPVPLEATYQRTWDRVPQAVKDMAVWD